MLVHVCFHHIQNFACSAPPGRNVPRTEISKQSGIATCVGSCRDPGSNRGPSDLRSDALPTELSRQWTYYVHMSEHQKKTLSVGCGSTFLVLISEFLVLPAVAVPYAQEGTPGIEEVTC